MPAPSIKTRFTLGLLSTLVFLFFSSWIMAISAGFEDIGLIKFGVVVTIALTGGLAMALFAPSRNCEAKKTQGEKELREPGSWLRGGESYTDWSGR